VLGIKNEGGVDGKKDETNFLFFFSSIFFIMVFLGLGTNRVSEK